MSVPHRGGLRGKPRTCKDLFNHVSCEQDLGEEGQRNLQEIIPDILIDGRFVSSTLDGKGAHTLRGVKTLVDVKTKSCDAQYPAEPTGKVGAVVLKRQTEVNKKYRKRAGELDAKQGSAPGVPGPFTKELNGYGQKGRVLVPVVGAFAEMSPDVYTIADLVSSALAEEHCSFFADSPSAMKALYTQRLYRSLGLTAHLGWARLLVDRYRDQVESAAPAASKTGPRNCSRDEEDAYEHESFMNPEARRAQ